MRSRPIADCCGFRLWEVLTSLGCGMDGSCGWNDVVRTPEERSILQQKGLACMLRALEYQPANSQLLFHTALLYADVRDVRSCAVIRAESLLSLDHRRDSPALLRCCTDCTSGELRPASPGGLWSVQRRVQSAGAVALLSQTLRARTDGVQARTDRTPERCRVRPFLAMSAPTQTVALLTGGCCVCGGGDVVGCW